LFFAVSCGSDFHKKAIEIDTSRFSHSDLLWDLKALSFVPEFKWVDSTSNVRSLIYKSVPYEGKPTEVFAYYSNPNLLRGRKNSGKVFPGVVLVHGGNGKAFKEWVEKWAADGYAAIAMDLNGKGENTQPLSNPGPVMDEKFMFANIDTGNLKDMWTYHAVARVILAHSLLLSLPEVNDEKTCLTGISWGGYLTCIAGSLDSRFKAVAPVYGCGYNDESDAFGKEFMKMTQAGHDKWMKYFDPSSYLPNATQPLFFINGNIDFFYNIVPYSKCYDLVKCEKNISLRPNMKHGHLEGWQPVEIKYFFDSKINDGTSLPHVDLISISDSIVSSAYSSVVGLRSASFYYSSDTLSSNQNREWSEVEARIDPHQKTISCRMPDQKFQYAFFYTTDHREVSVSSPIFLKIKN
ncbi:MAG TPA: acetylxylan esterase, partial [Bacteroidales bacterium]